jgi:hypothetical protein
MYKVQAVEELQLQDKARKQGVHWSKLRHFSATALNAPCASIQEHSPYANATPDTIDTNQDSSFSRLLPDIQHSRCTRIRAPMHNFVAPAISTT